MSVPAQGVDRRLVIVALAALPVLLEGCPGDRPRPIKPPPGLPTETDLPADGAYRYDFGGETPG